MKLYKRQTRIIVEELDTKYPPQYITEWEDETDEAVADQRKTLAIKKFKEKFSKAPEWDWFCIKTEERFVFIKED